MSIALDFRNSPAAPLSDRIATLRLVLRRIGLAWEQHRQAALLRRIDPRTRGDIGYSQDYVRADWGSFAALYPDTIAPAGARSATFS